MKAFYLANLTALSDLAKLAEVGADYNGGEGWVKIDSNCPNCGNERFLRGEATTDSTG
jgi:hypothetical protein